jgi:hypothetical protein
MNKIDANLNCLLKFVLIGATKNRNVEDQSKDVSDSNYDSYYREAYQIITGVHKHDLSFSKTPYMVECIATLVNYFESKEEYEKCAILHQVGYELFNTIN